ncbi:hypothetical protein ACSSS7_004265 [Eimeria intestinalis]
MEAASSKMMCMFKETLALHSSLAAGDAAASAFEAAPDTHGGTPSAEAADLTSALMTSETDASMSSLKNRLLSCSLSSIPIVPPSESEELPDEVQGTAGQPVAMEAQAFIGTAPPTALPPSSHARPPQAVHNVRLKNSNTSLPRQRLHRSCKMSDLAAGGAASTGKQVRPPERQQPISAGDETHSASAYSITKGSWDGGSAAAWLMASAEYVQDTNLECKGNTRDRQPATPSSRVIAASRQMNKSVSPAGVVRIGGRNRRKRTKYDLAYKQMEELGRFEEEVKSIDLSKVSGSNFVLKLLSNPSRYRYGTWADGCSWPVGADGRRLLLRKLRGVYWSDPVKWQHILEDNGLHRRDLFTLATVQDLFKVAHLMGAEAWDFLLKCTALTQKCDALSNRDVDVGDDEPLEAPSISDAAGRASQAGGARASQSGDELGSNSISGSTLPRSGQSRKRAVSGGGEDRESCKRRRGRPRNARLKAERHGAELAEAGNLESAEPADPAVITEREASTSWMSGAEAFLRVGAESEPLLRDWSGCRSSASPAILMEGQSVSAPAALNPSVQSSGSRALSPSSQRSSVPITSQDCSDSGGWALANWQDLSVDSRVVGFSSTTGGMLRLASHYTFMAQFMQCCMLVEVQKTLLRLAREIIQSFPAQKEFSQVCPESEQKKADLTSRACLESLVQSSSNHLEFVQVLLQQLCPHGNLGEPWVWEGGGSVFKSDNESRAILRQLRLICQKSLFSLTAPGAPPCPVSSNDEGSLDSRVLGWREQQSSNQASEGEPEECLFPVLKGQPGLSATPEFEGELKQCMYPSSEVHAEQCLTMASEAAHPEQCLSPASEQELDQCLSPAAGLRRLHLEQKGDKGEVFETANSRASRLISGESGMLCHTGSPLQRQPDGVTT